MVLTWALVSRCSTSAAAPTGAPADEGGQFAATVLGSTEDVWSEIFAAQGQRYRKPTLVLFSDAEHELVQERDEVRRVRPRRAGAASTGGRARGA